MGVYSQKRALENLRKPLGVAVRSVQWSYAIFWSLSTTKQGVLVWDEGYYNGDIKTRKTGPTEETNADKSGSRRSEQLRELYELLLEGGSVIEAGSNKRSLASLSPEDLSDLEWYYLVCMSFVFRPGQGLPGRTLANGRTIWLCNAQDADNKVFSRSLLAKSASVQTVICFPHMDGVIELGVTDAVLEDPNIIQHIKTSLLEFATPICSEKSSTQHDTDYDSNHTGAKNTQLSHETTFKNYYSSTENIKVHKEVANQLLGTMSDAFDNNEASPGVCSNMHCANNHHTEDSLMLDGNDDALSPRIHDSVDSSGCISQAFEMQDKPICSNKGRNINSRLLVQELEGVNPTTFGPLDSGKDDGEDLHYKQTVAIILQRRDFLVNGQSTETSHPRSSFMPWNSEVTVGRMCDNKSSQRTLKKMLFTVPSIIIGSPSAAVNKKKKDSCPLKPQGDNICNQSSVSKKSRKNEKYMVLGSLIPSVNKTDKTSVVDSTIEYLKELEARVEELESCVNRSEQEPRVIRKNMDMVEQTSDNCDHKSGSKRKASDNDDDEAQDPQLGRFLPRDSKPLDLDVKVSITGDEVLIEMKCSWREYLLVDIMEVINNLTLDAHTVQSAVLDGIMTLSIQSKFKGAAFVSAGMIRQALRRTAGIS